MKTHAQMVFNLYGDIRFGPACEKMENGDRLLCFGEVSPTCEECQVAATRHSKKYAKPGTELYADVPS